MWSNPVRRWFLDLEPRAPLMVEEKVCNALVSDDNSKSRMASKKRKPVGNFRKITLDAWHQRRVVKL